MQSGSSGTVSVRQSATRRRLKAAAAYSPTAWAWGKPCLLVTPVIDHSTNYSLLLTLSALCDLGDNIPTYAALLRGQAQFAAHVGYLSSEHGNQLEG